MPYLQMSFRQLFRDYLLDCFSGNSMKLDPIKGRGGMSYTIKNRADSVLGIYNDSFTGDLRIEVNLDFQDQDWVMEIEKKAYSVDADANEEMSPEEKVEEIIRQFNGIS